MQEEFKKITNTARAAEGAARMVNRLNRRGPLPLPQGPLLRAAARRCAVSCVPVAGGRSRGPAVRHLPNGAADAAGGEARHPRRERAGTNRGLAHMLAVTERLAAAATSRPAAGVRCGVSSARARRSAPKPPPSGRTASGAAGSSRPARLCARSVQRRMARLRSGRVTRGVTRCAHRTRPLSVV